MSCLLDESDGRDDAQLPLAIEIARWDGGTFRHQGDEHPLEALDAVGSVATDGPGDLGEAVAERVSSLNLKRFPFDTADLGR